MLMREVGGDSNTTIVVNATDLRNASSVALTSAQGLHEVGSRLGSRSIPDLPPEIASVIPAALASLASALNGVPAELASTAQELRARAFWADAADKLAAGYELEGSLLEEFKAGMASGVLQKFADPFTRELADKYFQELKDREDPDGFGGFLHDVGHGIADFAEGAFDAVKDPALMLYHLSPYSPDAGESWLNLGKGLWHGVTHPVEFGEALIGLDALRERGFAYWAGNLAPAAAAAFFTGGGSAALRGATATERVVGGLSDASRLARAVPERKFWKDISHFEGTKVYRRNDLIDPAKVDKVGRTNLERMADGLAPIGPDGKSVNLHHMIQTQDGPIAELTATFHQQNHKAIHLNPSSIPSGIDRREFDAWRARYWMDRAKGLEEGP
jgi:A nuclease of the HNH/ENDO VII superfamily with conserved LHH